MALAGSLAFSFLRDLQASRRRAGGFQQAVTSAPTNTVRPSTTSASSGSGARVASQTSQQGEDRGTITGKSSMQTARGKVDTINRSFADGSSSIQYRSSGKSIWVKRSPPDANGMQTVSVRQHTILANGERIVQVKDYLAPAGAEVGSDGAMLGSATVVRSNESLKSTASDGTVVWRPWSSENEANQREQDRADRSE